MDKQTVIITGASTGIGKAIAGLFLEKGGNVVMNSANEDNLRKTFKEFGSPANAVMAAGDISRLDTGEKLVKAAVENFGSIDVLINNAGVFAPKPFLEVVENDLDRYISINLKGTFFTTQAVIRKMIETGGGSVINIGTVLVDHAIAGFPASAPLTSKGGIHALTKQLAAEFGQYNIRVNTIAPGVIKTPLQAKFGFENVDGLAGLHLLNKVGTPEDIAETAYYLAASKFVTGEILNVDGGHLAGHQFG